MKGCIFFVFKTDPVVHGFFLTNLYITTLFWDTEHLKFVHKHSNTH